MDEITLNSALVALQFVVGMLVVVGAVVLLSVASDHSTGRLVRWPIVGLGAWGAWFAYVGYLGRHDSPPAMAFALAVALVVLIYAREISGILKGETWWPPHSIPSRTVQQSPRRLPRPWYQKLNPIWALIGNDDDGLYGDDKWRAGRAKTWRLAVEWWLRNPMHNLMWYGIGVADRWRAVVGRWGDAFHRPGGGWLWCRTVVAIGSRRIVLPYVSYISEHVKAYAGWRPSGAFGLKLNISLHGDIEVPA